MSYISFLPIPGVSLTQSTKIFHAETTDGNLKGYSQAGYLIIWNYSTGNVQDSLDSQGIGQKNEYVPFMLDADTIWRTAMFFDTRSLADEKPILSATLRIYGVNFHDDRSFNITIQQGSGDVPHEPLESADYWQGYYSGSGGSLPSTSFLTDEWNTIGLTTLTWINKTDKTHLILRTDREINADEPPNNSWEYVTVATAETTHPPTLTVVIEEISYGWQHRHIPFPVLLILLIVFLLTGGRVGHFVHW